MTKIKLTEGIGTVLKEQISEPETITQLRDVMKSGYKNMKDPKSGKTMKVDSYSASAIVKVYDALNDINRDKFSKLGLLGMQNVAFKVINK
jgi:phosphoribosylformylglycinamidine (FGAM) synthase PurS component